MKLPDSIVDTGLPLIDGMEGFFWYKKNSQWIAFILKDDDKVYVSDGLNLGEQHMDTYTVIFCGEPVEKVLKPCGVTFNPKPGTLKDKYVLLADLTERKLYAGPNEIVKAYLVEQAKANEVRKDDSAFRHEVGLGINFFLNYVCFKREMAYGWQIDNRIAKILSVSRSGSSDYKVTFAVISGSDYSGTIRLIRDGKDVRSYSMILSSEANAMCPLEELSHCFDVYNSGSFVDLSPSDQIARIVGFVGSRLADKLFRRTIHYWGAEFKRTEEKVLRF